MKKKDYLVLILLVIIDMGKNFSGEITTEESNASPDINIIAAYIEQEDGIYKKSNDIPQEGYIINKEKSVCSNGAIPSGNVHNIMINNLTKSGTNCYLYFEKENSDNVGNTSSDKILKELNINVNNEVVDFSNAVLALGGVYKADDNDGDSYYWRGAVTNNYLKFGKNLAGEDMWWRIIRINGDGTLRIIYDGTECHYNGTKTINSIAIRNTSFNSKGYNAYVGFMYGTAGSATYEEEHANVNKSGALISLEKWYIDNLSKYTDFIDINAGFCGDRTSTITRGSAPDGSGGFGQTYSYYGAEYRVYYNKMPSLKCSQERDLYTLNQANKGNKILEYPIGLISADEVAMAGGVWDINNDKYYLYNGNSYWTMSPAHFGEGDNTASVVRVLNNGALYGGDTSNGSYHSISFRPVINLRTTIKLVGSGIAEDPFIVVGAE